MTAVLTTDRIERPTQGDADVLDITGDVAAKVREHGLVEGHVLLFVVGSTAALTTVEYEPGLARDLPEMFERLAPRAHDYHHEKTWHDGNGHSHCRASLLGPSLTVPVEEGRLILGTWQQVVLLDFDNRPRQRTVVIQLSGRR